MSAFADGGMLRYVWTAATGARRFMYDGSHIILDHQNDGTVNKRYVYGPGADEPIVEYAGSGTTNKTWLSADERGSIVAGTDSSGDVTFINTYDEYGKPSSGNTGMFQYTGQAWIEELGLYYYKARFYNPDLGKFMQTDPIGYSAGLNMYNYVGGDPINGTDPSGLIQLPSAILPLYSNNFGNTGAGSISFDIITVIGHPYQWGCDHHPDACKDQLHDELMRAFLNGLQNAFSPQAVAQASAAAVGATIAAAKECGKQPGDNLVLYAPHELFRLGAHKNLLSRFFDSIHNGKQAEFFVQSSLLGAGLSVSPQISFTSGITTARVDFASTDLQTGEIAFHEVKFGNSSLTFNQRIVYPAIASGTASPFGANAIQLGLEPYKPIGEQISGIPKVDLIRVCPK